ncbi:Uncharacterised protein [Mycobacteroides abscessus subsp. massiliense]|nr:Uncharacterised protein [Mycobacteroides abscessus subsp. abscessus]SKQ84865.1 Uncharacterised protein [Mycobacteroides abscessus subsp. massiliense]SLC49317.1 Uncharacterised protein [Mycobacteroides abscessus subsp. massiliense]
MMSAAEMNVDATSPPEAGVIAQSICGGLVAQLGEGIVRQLDIDCGALAESVLRGLSVAGYELRGLCVHGSKHGACLECLLRLAGPGPSVRYG